MKEEDEQIHIPSRNLTLSREDAEKLYGKEVNKLIAEQDENFIEELAIALGKPSDIGGQHEVDLNPKSNKE